MWIHTPDLQSLERRNLLDAESWFMIFKVSSRFFLCLQRDLILFLVKRNRRWNDLVSARSVNSKENVSDDVDDV
jgi:hypothetical protein